MTLTLKHGRGDHLLDLFGGLSKAWSRITSGKNGQALRKAGAPEYVRGYDLTWSPRHGWHPHVHVVLLLPPGHGTGEATARAFSARWITVLAGLGFTADALGQDVQECRDAAAAAAYATTPAAVYEATGIGTKTARRARAGATPFDILREAVPLKGAGDVKAMARWVEYVTAVKGRRQTTVSRGLTLDDDQVLMDVEPEAPVDAIATIGPETIHELDRTGRTAELLEGVEQADSPGARRMVAWAVLGSLRVQDWHMIRHDGEEEPPPTRWGPDAIDLAIPW